MIRLGHRDVEELLIAVGAVSASRDPDEFAHLALTHVSRLIQSDVVSFNEIDPFVGRLVYLMEPSSFVVPGGVAEHFEALADEQPLVHHFARTGDGSAKKISDFWTTAEFQTSKVYQLVYRPMGVEYQMAMTLPTPRPVVIGIAVNRATSDFSERDRLVLNTLRPHFVQAWRNANEQSRLQGLLAAATDASLQGGASILVLSDPPHELTPGALVLLYRYFGRPTPDNPLPIRVQRWLVAQRARLEPSGLPELSKPLLAEVAGRRMLLRYLPPQAEHPGALLLKEEEPSPSRRRFEDLGLTAREADVVAGVVEGKTNAEIGYFLHVSQGTVKKHLDNIYAKLGVRGRGRVAAFVLDVAEHRH